MVKTKTTTTTLTESPYFHKRNESPYFRRSPSSAFGAVQSLGSLLSCLGRCIEINNNNNSPMADSQTLMQNAIRHFEDCATFRKAWQNNNNDDDLDKSVRHLCRHRCYFRAYAPARAWLALREKVQSSLPIQRLLDGWSCILLPSKEHPRVAFVDPSNRIFRNEAAVLQKILSNRDSRSRGISRTKLPKVLLFDCQPTNEAVSISTKRRKKTTLSSARTTDSPFGLLEELFLDDPFRLLLSAIFLNRTTRIQVDHVLCEFLETWPTPESVLGAELDHLVTVLRPMGMCHRRAAGIQSFTHDYLKCQNTKNMRKLSAHDLQQMFYCGRYATDAYLVFIRRNWSIEPQDHALRAYVCYQRSLECKKRGT